MADEHSTALYFLFEDISEFGDVLGESIWRLGLIFEECKLLVSII